MGGGTRLTRRQVVGGAAATAAAAAVPVSPADARRRSRRARHADVVIVGAGLSGLAAADVVMKAGRSPLVLEARERVGGRTLNHHIGGGKVIEAGGEGGGPTQDPVHAHLRELGPSTHPPDIPGNHGYDLPG